MELFKVKGEILWHINAKNELSTSEFIKNLYKRYKEGCEQSGNALIYLNAFYEAQAGDTRKLEKIIELKAEQKTDFVRLAYTTKNDVLSKAKVEINENINFKNKYSLSEVMNHLKFSRRKKKNKIEKKEDKKNEQIINPVKVFNKEEIAEFEIKYMQEA